MAIRATAFLLLLLVLLGGAVAAMGWYARGSYFVAVEHGELTIYKGRPGGLLWFRPTVAERTGIPSSDVLPSRLDDLKRGKEEISLADARQYVEHLKAEAQAHASTSAGTATRATGGSTSKCPNGITIGFFGALTGNNSPQMGINEANGVQLAIDQFNKAHADCHVNYKPFDSQGDPKLASALAQQGASDKKLVALVGPGSEGESKAADPIFNDPQVGVPIITASATNPVLTKYGWKIFHRALANSDAEGPAVARYILTKLNAKSVAVIDDASDYGKSLSTIVAERVSAGGATLTQPGSIDKSHNYPSTVNAVKAAGVDAIFYAGNYQEAGPLAKQLKEAGVKAPFISGDGSLDAGFVAAAGDGAEGALLTGPAAYAFTVPYTQDFVSAYKAKFSSDPALYSGEAYDAANHILAAIAAGKYTRADINTYISTTPYKGLLKTYAYDSTGELKGTPVIFVHKVVNGKITLVGPA